MAGRQSPLYGDPTDPTGRAEDHDPHAEGVMSGFLTGPTASPRLESGVAGGAWRAVF